MTLDKASWSSTRFLFRNPLPTRRGCSLTLFKDKTMVTEKRHGASPNPRGLPCRTSILGDLCANKLATFLVILRLLAGDPSPCPNDVHGTAIFQWKKLQTRHTIPYTTASGGLGLECDGVDTICVETFVNMPRRLDEGGHRLVRNNDMGRREGLALVQAPDVEFMNGFHPGDL